jgi:hypothetical protein
VGDSQDLEALICALQAQAALLAEQIAALREPPANDTHMLVLRYLALQSTPKVAAWAQRAGMTLKGAAGGMRRLRAQDVAQRVARPEEPVPAVLLEMARRIFERNSKAAQRRFD